MLLRSYYIFIPLLFSIFSFRDANGIVDFKNIPPDINHSFLKDDPEFESLTIPVKVIGELIVVEATIDGQVGNFVLDTGAPTLVLNKTYFRKEARISENLSVGLDGKNDNAHTAFVDLFEINRLKFEKISAKVSDLRNIEDHIGFKLLGLIGVSLLKNFIVTIDMNESIVHIATSDDQLIKYERVRSIKPDLTVPLDYNNNSVSMLGTIGGQNLRFVLDTGAETNVLDNRLSRKVMDEVLILKRIVLNGSTGGQVEALAGIIQHTEIDGISFVKMRTLITNIHELKEAYGYRMDGMLGYDFLARGIVTIDFINGKLSMNLYNNLRHK